MKQNEDKVERMLWLLEHTDEATDAEIQRLMEDDECREVYETMVLTEQAFRFNSGNTNIKSRKSRLPLRRKVAAAVAVILLAGGAVAAVSHFTDRPSQDWSDYAYVMDKGQMSAVNDTVINAVEEQEADVVVFNERELKDVLSVIAAHYGVGHVAFRTEPLMHVRLYFQWDRSASVEQAVEMLNHFEKIDVTLHDDVLVVDVRERKEQVHE